MSDEDAMEALERFRQRMEADPEAGVSPVKVLAIMGVLYRWLGEAGGHVEGGPLMTSGEAAAQIIRAMILSERAAL